MQRFKVRIQEFSKLVKLLNVFQKPVTRFPSDLGGDPSAGRWNLGVKEAKAVPQWPHRGVLDNNNNYYDYNMNLYKYIYTF